MNSDGTLPPMTQLQVELLINNFSDAGTKQWAIQCICALNYGTEERREGNKQAQDVDQSMSAINFKDCCKIQKGVHHHSRTDDVNTLLNM